MSQNALALADNQYIFDNIPVFGTKYKSGRVFKTNKDHIQIVHNRMAHGLTLLGVSAKYYKINVILQSFWKIKMNNFQSYHSSSQLKLRTGTKWINIVYKSAKKIFYGMLKDFLINERKQVLIRTDFREEIGA